MRRVSYLFISSMMKSHTEMSALSLLSSLFSFFAAFIAAFLAAFSASVLLGMAFA